MSNKKKPPHWDEILKNIFILGIWLIILLVIVVLAVFLYFARQIPNPETIITRRISESTKIYDRTGQVVLFDVFGEERRTIITLEQIPQKTRLAVLAAEDANFYQHKGLDTRGILRAVLENIRGFSISQGGSTITQQLIKNSILGKERTFSRKLKEAILALEIERRFPKEQILWMYLNQISFGSNIYGLEMAAKTYFNKSASALTVKESAVLAAIIQLPTYYSPFGQHREELLERSHFILSRMHRLNFITEEEFKTALAEEVNFAEENTKGILAPHFVIYLREQLFKLYGQERVQNGGLKVVSTLDWTMQQNAEKIVKDFLDKNGKALRASNAALIALDPASGEILTMLGSRDYFDRENEGNFNVTTALRQPGSAFKPIAYASAIEQGFPDTTIVFDLATEFNSRCSGDALQKKDSFGLDCYHPKNYDGKNRGPVSMRVALGSSLNIPSVKFLHLAGINNVVKLAERMGITSLKNNTWGLSLVLGGAEVSLLELANSYGVFAQDGVFTPHTAILRVETSQGEVLFEQKPERTRVLNEQTSRTISSILIDNSARTPVFGPNSILFIPNRPVAVKTGTTQENKDAWALGYTPSLVVGVWVGNNNNAPMSTRGIGAIAAGPIWRQFITETLTDKPSENFPQPQPFFINTPMLNGRISGFDGEIHSILHYIRPNDALYLNWEWPVRQNYPILITPVSSPQDEIVDQLN